MTIPDLTKRGWRFVPRWIAGTETWCIYVSKATWGIGKSFYSADWDDAHERAAAWAAEEERIITGPDRRDTEPAPAMEVCDAE